MGDCEVLVEVRAASLDPVDLKVGRPGAGVGAVKGRWRLRWRCSEAEVEVEVQ